MGKLGPSELIAHAEADERRFSDLLVVELADGSTMHRICNFDLILDVDVGDGWGVQSFYPIPFVRSEITSESDLTIEDTMITLPNVELSWSQAATPFAMALGQAARIGLLDGAVLRLYLYDHEAGEVFYHSDWLVGDIPQITRVSIAVHLQSYDIEIDRQSPPCVFGESCNNAVYDAICGLNPALYTYEATAGLDGGQWDLWSDRAEADGTWDLAMLEFLTGSNAGLRRLVRKYYAPGIEGWSRFIFTHALPAPTMAGDEFQVTLGCTKSLTICTTRFVNQARFRGFPYIPKPEVMLP
jgi:uncharacterized phage protein (TIGR02218 family)